ncbi:alpha-amylase family protein [Spirosoma aerophilum]
MPTSLETLQADWYKQYATYTEAYQSGRSSYIPNLLPQTAVQFSVYQTLEILHKRLGNEMLRRALDPAETVESPARIYMDGSWLKRSNMVGVNVRTIGSFWKLVSYVMTLPASHDSIHLLPIWEPGVVGSLYGMVSWQINPEFFDVELARYVPALDSVEKQLKVVMNLLHAMGRTVGMDVIPHTDRFSEMVLTCPSLFEWVQRDEKGKKPAMLIDHSSLVYRYAEEAIWQFLKFRGSADGTPLTFTKDAFFSMHTPTASTPGLSDEQRQRILFGLPNDYNGRLSRRLGLIRHLVAQGLETLPMTMAPPYRGLHIDANDFVTDDYGQVWYQYAFNEPQAMSRVFGPLARYRFYESKDNNKKWELDFDRPNLPAWDYICRKVKDCQQKYNFDFMRGDMAHVQLRPEGVPAEPDAFYDPLRAIKRYVQEKGVPYYAFFAETFLAPPDTMGYGDELDHLEAIEADSTLGDLQSMVVGSTEFRRQFAAYVDYLKTRRFAPNFTVMTADKDDPRFDAFYRTGNLFRYFVALFLTDMPSYVGLGFEVRNLHEQRGQNEEYTKLYVFRIEDDRQPDKVTHGSFEWGQNADQFAAIGRMRAFAESIWPDIAGKATRWLNSPDYIVWTQSESTASPGYIFAASMTGPLPDIIPGMEAETVVFEEEGCRVYRRS